MPTWWPVSTPPRATPPVGRSTWWTAPVRPGSYASAMHNEGEALLGLGDLDGARLSFLRCLDLARAHGLDRTPAALWGLAEIEFQAGRLGDARAAFEEAVDLARETGERQVLAPTLARLATIIATEPRGAADLDLAGRLAAESCTLAPDESRPEALTACGLGEPGRRRCRGRRVDGRGGGGRRAGGPEPPGAGPCAGAGRSGRAGPPRLGGPAARGARGVPTVRGDPGRRPGAAGAHPAPRRARSPGHRGAGSGPPAPPARRARPSAAPAGPRGGGVDRDPGARGLRGDPRRRTGPPFGVAVPAGPDPAEAAGVP